MSGQAASEGRSEVLAVDDLSVTLGGRRILDHVTFSVAAGSLTGLIGANGAGKTTLFRAILGLVNPTGGQVRLAGRPRTRRTSTIGYVPQKIALEPDVPMRARDLVALGVDGHRFGVPRPTRGRQTVVEDMLRAVDAGDFADARVGDLSGGEQQRVMIAHALVSRPRLLLLDEPLANLDIRAAQEVVDLLSRVAGEHQVAILLSAHDMNPLLGIMDHLVYLASGRAASGTTEEVVRTDTLSDLYGHPVEVIHTHGRVIVVAGRDELGAADSTGQLAGSRRP